MGRQIPVAIGRGGIGTKRGEGDGITPLGTHRVEEWMGRTERVHGRAVIGDPIRLGDLWCDDPGHPDYNRLTRAPLNASHESMRRPDPLYDIVGIVDFNRNPIVAGAGSAIFIHQWRKPRHPTEGCVAFSHETLKWIAANWQSDSRLIIS